MADKSDIDWARMPILCDLINEYCGDRYRTAYFARTEAGAKKFWEKVFSDFSDLFGDKQSFAEPYVRDPKIAGAIHTSHPDAIWMSVHDGNRAKVETFRKSGKRYYLSEEDFMDGNNQSEEKGRMIIAECKNPGKKLNVGHAVQLFGYGELLECLYPNYVNKKDFSYVLIGKNPLNDKENAELKQFITKKKADGYTVKWIPYADDIEKLENLD